MSINGIIMGYIPLRQGDTSSLSITPAVWDASHMKKGSALARNLKERMERERLNPKSLSLNAGLNETYVRDILIGKSLNPTEARLAKLATALHCDVADLTGKMSLSMNVSGVKEQPGPDPQTVTIPELDVRAMGGAGAEDQPPNGDGSHVVLAEWLIPADFLRSVTPTPHAVRIIRVIGDSMEPSYVTGDRLLVDTSHKFPSPPAIYVTWDGYGLVLKHVEIIQGRDPPVARLSSDNPAYAAYEVPVADLKIQGRVMGRWVWK